MQRLACRAALGLILSLGGMSLAAAASLPPATEGDWVAAQFTFHNGQQLANLKLHYITLGNPSTRRSSTCTAPTGRPATC